MLRLFFKQDCLLDFSSIDIILISNYHFMLALPFITEVSFDLFDCLTYLSVHIWKCNWVLTFSRWHTCDEQSLQPSTAVGVESYLLAAHFPFLYFFACIFHVKVVFVFFLFHLKTALGECKSSKYKTVHNFNRLFLSFVSIFTILNIVHVHVHYVAWCYNLSLPSFHSIQVSKERFMPLNQQYSLEGKHVYGVTIKCIWSNWALCNFTQTFL